jgi:hypothetical protein
MGTTRMPTPIRPKKANGREQNVYWIRKKVPVIVGNSIRLVSGVELGDALG